jgi:uncharacterized protein YbjT (DUF2867 family)
MTQTALVVGASGIVGSAITELLLENAWQVAALSRHPAAANGVIPVAADLQDPASVKQALEGHQTDSCVHHHLVAAGNRGREHQGQRRHGA